MFDSEGDLLMNLGALVTLSNKAPKNLVHFVFDNGVYAVTGGQPVGGSGQLGKALAQRTRYQPGQQYRHQQ